MSDRQASKDSRDLRDIVERAWDKAREERYRGWEHNQGSVPRKPAGPTRAPGTWPPPSQPDARSTR